MVARFNIRGGRWLRSLGWGLLSLLARVLAAGAWVGELRNLALYTLAPRYARDANFVHFAKHEAEVFILGTIHGRHLATPAYSLAHLKAVIARMKPRLLLVEARPEGIARQRWGDGPVEMPFAALYARQLGIAVDGIDWWTLSDRRRLSPPGSG